MFLTCCLAESSAVFVIHSANVFNMLFDRILSCFCHIQLMFLTCCFLVFESFSQKRHLSLGNVMVADGFVVLAFLMSLHYSLSNGFFCSFIK